jgi:hypothetical protein
MDRAAIELTIRILITKTRSRLDDAALSAAAAEACALAGSVGGDIKLPIYEAGRLQVTASLLEPCRK